MAAVDPFDSALDLLRRLNPKHTSEHLNALIALAPDLTEDLLSSVDQPLAVRRCRQSGRDYLLCDYNRDGDSYRSPWSNEFDPPLQDTPASAGEEQSNAAGLPSEKVRRMEIRANEAFDLYRELYYEGGVSSVYFWNLDDGFAGVVLLKKVATPGTSSEGTWDSIHVFEAIDRARFTQEHDETDRDRAAAESDEQQIANIGKLVEDMELKMRNLLQEVYFGKAKDVVGDLRSVGSLSESARDREAQRDIIGSMKR
ncbi:hypothetical protein E0Z10_g8382 [Xylaria hypoxylon]|uniref:F-actin-capping protein subunit beta n=1 Tax=Xylaria hypoxylon TaxID=37992 RepID=A0A4Z0YLQ7_9PEZI|nr:hypothetical protein E0Z10_g8382 [Xylaria hypoxylon]